MYDLCEIGWVIGMVFVDEVWVEIGDFDCVVVFVGVLCDKNWCVVEIVLFGGGVVFDFD